MTNVNKTGGWAYYAGKQSRIEPTGWALLALAETTGQDPAEWRASAAPHLQFIARCQREDGLLIDAPGAPPNFTANGLAACVLTHVAAGDDGALLTRLLDAIVSVKGVAIRTPILDALAGAVRRLAGGGQPEGSGLDASLQAWPWIPDTFSWVEPTSWCVLALKKTRPAARPRGAESRIQEADAVLTNRICSTGGWNYGNAAVFGQDLRAYVPTTAVGLMALQDRRADPAVSRTVTYLDRARLKEPSAMALALGALALRLCELPVDDVDERLAADAGHAERLGNLQALAMMLYALSADRHAVRAFRV